MKAGLNYYVIQRKGGEVFTHGPFRSEGARDNRYDSISGGEVYRFNSLSSDAEVAKREFRDEEVKRIG